MTEPRINDPETVHAEAIRETLERGARPTVQFSRPGVSERLLGHVNELCREFGDQLEIRFYGFYGTYFDASVVKHLPDVQWLSADCLTEIRNEDRIAELPLLRRLSFGVYRFDRPRFLEIFNLQDFTQLALSENAKHNFDLASLARAQALKTLYLTGHTKNVEVLGALPSLSRISLNSIPKRQGLGFVSGIKSLRSLSIMLGGRTGLDEICHPALEELIVVRVRGLESLGALDRFPALRLIQIEDQLQIRSIDIATPHLERVLLFNCKNLRQIQGLEALDELAEIRVSRTGLDLEALLEHKWPKSMKVVALYSGSRKWNEAARASLDRRGYGEKPLRQWTT